MFTPRMFDMWNSVTTKLEAHTQIQTNITNIQTTTSLQNSSSGSIKGESLIIVINDGGRGDQGFVGVPKNLCLISTLKTAVFS